MWCLWASHCVWSGKHVCLWQQLFCGANTHFLPSVAVCPRNVQRRAVSCTCTIMPCEALVSSRLHQSKSLTWTYIFHLFVSLPSFHSEGEQEEAWLTEAGLAQMVDNSLTPNVEEVTNSCHLLFVLPPPSPNRLNFTSVFKWKRIHVLTQVFVWGRLTGGGQQGVPVHTD